VAARGAAEFHVVEAADARERLVVVCASRLPPAKLAPYAPLGTPTAAARAGGGNDAGEELGAGVVRSLVLSPSTDSGDSSASSPSSEC
jgi:hypothetical protein